MYPEARKFGARRQCGVLGTEAKRAHQYAAWPWSIRVQRKNYKENGGYSHPPSAARRATGVQPDVTTDQRTGQSYYTIRVSMQPEEVARLGDVKLIPGMPVEAFVQTGERTMLSYLIKPLSDQLMRAFREK